MSDQGFQEPVLQIPGRWGTPEMPSRAGFSRCLCQQRQHVFNKAIQDELKIELWTKKDKIGLGNAPESPRVVFCLKQSNRSLQMSVPCCSRQTRLAGDDVDGSLDASSRDGVGLWSWLGFCSRHFSLRAVSGSLSPWRSGQSDRGQVTPRASPSPDRAKTLIRSLGNRAEVRGLEDTNDHGDSRKANGLR